MKPIVEQEEEEAAAAPLTGGLKNWAVDIQSEADRMNTAAETEKWRKHSIYRVPTCIKDLNPKAYTPQVVSFGPHHHGEQELAPMEEHKRRSVLHLLRRSRKRFDNFVEAVETVEQQLMDAYERLDERWSGEGVEQFRQMMVVDGCFMLEVLRAATAVNPPEDYAPNDPIFSPHGLLYMVPCIKRDMLMLENQLPLLVLDKLIAVETGRTKNDDHINRMVQRCFAPNERYVSMPLGLHPLDVYRRILLQLGGTKSAQKMAAAGDHPHHDEEGGLFDTVRSAMELYEAGIRFKRSRSNSLQDIRFKHGVLSLPAVVVDDLTEAMFRNMMAFERLHVGAGNDVTSFVFFMDSIIDSAKDVALLQWKGLIQNAMGSDKAVAKLFNSLSKEVPLDPDSPLDRLQRRVNRYCRQNWNKWRANLVHTYFRSPWAFLSLAAAIFLLILTVAQTVFTILQWQQGLNDNNSPSPAGTSPSDNIAPSPILPTL
ncbi:hypothetical protein Taro_014327 [Colocasia esculenta]|uniref:Uncharacterized protein n=1 Tax=Colocasia esculenta TaxID=4460 RepID=A0A843UIR4_COLES|nr:hypothetical protein [Colocasia esculenta]